MGGRGGGRPASAGDLELCRALEHSSAAGHGLAGGDESRRGAEVVQAVAASLPWGLQGSRRAVDEDGEVRRARGLQAWQNIPPSLFPRLLCEEARSGGASKRGV